MIKLGRVSKKTRGTPTVGFIEDIVLMNAGDKIPV